jgi:hypothetical protein
MGKRGRAFVEQWITPESQAERYEALFSDLVGRAAARAR